MFVGGTATAESEGLGGCFGPNPSVHDVQKRVRVVTAARVTEELCGGVQLRQRVKAAVRLPLDNRKLRRTHGISQEHLSLLFHVAAHRWIRAFGSWEPSNREVILMHRHERPSRRSNFLANGRTYKSWPPQLGCYKLCITMRS